MDADDAVERRQQRYHQVAGDSLQLERAALPARQRELGQPEVRARGDQRHGEHPADLRHLSQRGDLMKHRAERPEEQHGK